MHQPPRGVAWLEHVHAAEAATRAIPLDSLLMDFPEGSK